MLAKFHEDATEALKSSTNARALIKWRRLPLKNYDQVAARLQRLKNFPPPHVPRLLSYGLVDKFVRFEFERIHGLSLHQLKNAWDNSQPERSDNQFKTRLNYCFAQVFDDWERAGFIHGDLSPRNILVHGQTPMRLWCIDWIADLRGFEGTPRYASHEVLKGHRSFQTDRYAFDTILKSWGHG